MTAPPAQDMVPVRPASDPPLPVPSGVLHIPQSMQDDLRRDIGNAAFVASAMPDEDGDAEEDTGDVKIAAFTAAVCEGSTPRAVFLAAARYCATAEERGQQISATHWARVPGPTEGDYEYRMALMVSFPEAGTGEYTADTHTDADDDGEADGAAEGNGPGPQVSRGTAGHRVEHHGTLPWS
jgi:hypothetical protein